LPKWNISLGKSVDGGVDYTPAPANAGSKDCADHAEAQAQRSRRIAKNRWRPRR
jgi:hypothetical protein